MALKLVLEPIFEADMYPISYGFRPGRSTHDALARVRHELNPTSAGPSRTRYVIEGDIKGCFENRRTPVPSQKISFIRSARFARKT